MFKFLNIFIFIAILLVTRYGMEISIQKQLLNNSKTSFLFIEDVSVDNVKIIKRKQKNGENNEN